MVCNAVCWHLVGPNLLALRIPGTATTKWGVYFSMNLLAIAITTLKRHANTRFLRHTNQSPQLPFGYPTSVLLALAPPLWFAVMNPQVSQLRQQVQVTP